MRKYYQAALVLIALISLVSLLVYRHEYNKLRYVLAVLSYFGSNGEKANCSDSAQAALNKLYNQETSEYYKQHRGFKEPVPSWQRLTDEIYIYSAYHTSDGEIRAIGLSGQSNLELSCDIFFENDMFPLAGKFTSKLIESLPSQKSSTEEGEIFYQGYHFVCNYVELQEKKSVAYVKFITKLEEDEATLILPVKEFKSNGRNKVENEIVTACVVPPVSRPIFNNDIIEFLNFHISVGFDNFIVYDFGIASRLNAMIEQIFPLISENKLVTYTALPWNFPFSQISSEVVANIIETDCLYRTYGNVGILATLAWDEFIVLKYHHRIEKLFRDFDKTGYQADRYKIPSMNYCVERLGSQSDLSVSSRIYGSEKIDMNRPIFIYRRTKSSKRLLTDNDLVTRGTSTDVTVVYRYKEHCDRVDGLKIIPLDESYVGKYSKSMKNSTLSKLFRLYTS